MLKSLTSLRFFAALMVFLFHMGMSNNYQFGYLFVPFFFILSGFILTINYYNKFDDLNLQVISKFYAARVARIYPVHFITFLLVLPIVFHDKMFPVYESLQHFLLKSLINLSLLQSFMPHRDIYFSFNGVTWSLSCEIFFYFTMPFILWFLIQINKRLDIKLKVVSLLIVYLIFEKLWTHIGLAKIYPWSWFFIINPVINSSFFLSGIFIGFIYLSRPKPNNKILFIYSILEIISVTLIVLLNCYGITHHLNPYKYFVTLFIFCIYIFSFQSGIISKLLSTKMFVYLGEVSFSFYMVHQIVIHYIYKLINPHLPKTALIAMVAFLVSLTLSILLYHFVEEPMRRVIRYKMYDKVRSWWNKDYQKTSLKMNKNAS